MATENSNCIESFSIILVSTLYVPLYSQSSTNNGPVVSQLYYATLVVDEEFVCGAIVTIYYLVVHLYANAKDVSVLL